MSGSSDISAAMRLQAYALLVNLVPEPVRGKVLGQIVKELNLPITLEELKASEHQAPFVPVPIVLLCPFCHISIKIEKPPLTQEEAIDKVKEHLPSCVLVEALATQVASKIGQSK